MATNETNNQVKTSAISHFEQLLGAYGDGAMMIAKRAVDYMVLGGTDWGYQRNVEIHEMAEIITGEKS